MTPNYNLPSPPNIRMLRCSIMTIPRFNTSGRFDPASLFRPASIAVVGADTEAGDQIVANLALSGYKGEVQAIIDASQVSGTPQLADPGGRAGAGWPLHDAVGAA